MASLYRKVINGKPYWYLREMARVDGKPKMVSERYLGTAQDIAGAVGARDAAALPARTRHLGFGDLAAAWGVLARVGVVEVIDEVVGARRSDASASVGTYLALAALNRLVAPCSKLAFADWWKTTAAGRFLKIPSAVLDHRRFWDAMHAVGAQELARIEQRLALRMIETFRLDISALALDMTNFATYIDSTNERAPIAQRGKAKQKRADLLAERLVLRAQPVRGGDGPPSPLVGGQQRVHEADVLDAGAQRGAHPLGVLAQHLEVDHDRSA